MSLAEQPAGLDAETRGFPAFVGPEALEGSDLLIVLINDIVIDVLFERSFWFQCSYHWFRLLWDSCL
jgi:hypothetical protein